MLCALRLRASRELSQCETTSFALILISLGLVLSHYEYQSHRYFCRVATTGASRGRSSVRDTHMPAHRSGRSPHHSVGAVQITRLREPDSSLPELPSTS